MNYKIYATSTAQKKQPMRFFITKMLSPDWVLRSLKKSKTSMMLYAKIYLLMVVLITKTVYVMCL